MKARVTILTENNTPFNADMKQYEEKARDVWSAFINLLRDFADADEKVSIESFQVFDDEPTENPVHTPDQNGDKYALTMTTDEARTVARACEFYARVLMGQFDEIAYETLMQSKATKVADFSERREIMDDMLFIARKMVYPDLQGRGHSYGVGHNPAGDRAWAAYEVIRHAIAWHEHPEGGNGVDFYPPMGYGVDTIPKCEVVKEGAADGE